MRRCLTSTILAVISLVAMLAWTMSTGAFVRQPLRRHAWGALPDLEEPTDIRTFSFPDWAAEEAFAKKRLAERPLHPVPRLTGESNSPATYGVDHDELAKLSSEWANSWSWRESPVISTLRGFPHYIWRVAGIDVHFMHVHANPAAPAAGCPANVRRMPLLLLHGWPGSVLEFSRVLPLLTERCGPNGTIFDVVAPSLPGFGFSSVPTVGGLGVVATAELFVRLMGRLGYNGQPEGWWVQGGDWGGVIAAAIAQVIGAAAPEDRQFLRLPASASRLPLRGVHVNFVAAAPLWSALMYGASAALPQSLQWLLWGGGDAGVAEYERSGLPLARLVTRILDLTGYLRESRCATRRLGLL